MLVFSFLTFLILLGTFSHEYTNKLFQFASSIYEGTNVVLFLSFFLSLHSFLTVTAGSWEERKRQKRRGPRLLTARLFEASLSGLAAASCVSKPRLAFYPLCQPRCVKCTELLCSGEIRHIAFCLLSPIGWEGGVERGIWGRQKANLQRARALQSMVAQRLMKRYFMQRCARCNCGVPEDRESLPIQRPTPRYLERAAV